TRFAAHLRIPRADPRVPRQRAAVQRGQASPLLGADESDADDAPPLVLSGGIVKGKLDGEAAMVHTTLGDGHLVLFAWNPMHRHITQHDHALVYNAIMFWNDLDRPGAAEDASP
ncbi:MAG: hypothetical protein O7E49_02995, partial [Gemmatimonadetes bacterium]|nr:hypothetical protein [Gemmatimonadota bacterium]